MNSKPDTIEEAIYMIVAQMKPEDMAKYAKQPKDRCGAHFHFFGGMNMRNSWGLWKNTGKLNKWFRDNGVWHGDDKSGIIFIALWCALNLREFNISNEADFYIRFWKKNGVGFDNKKL